MCPDRFENANFSLRTGLPSDEYGYRKCKLLKTLSRGETFENANLADTCGPGKTEHFENADVTAALPNMAPDRRETLIV